MVRVLKRETPELSLAEIGPNTPDFLLPAKRAVQIPGTKG